MTLNEKTVKVNITRSELCTLMLGCTLLGHQAELEEPSTKWKKLHDKLAKILYEFDEKQSI